MPKAKNPKPKIIDFQKIEKKWQTAWEDKKAFVTTENSKKKKFYVLEMFPYPSASFLHVGHVRNYTIGDVYARFKRMSGFNVLYPMGYDSFGLPAENAARKEGIHPKKYTQDAIKKIIEYQKALGNSYDWTRIIATHTPEYYKWNQFIFLKFLEKNLVYRKKAAVNWCPSCKTVLADEEVEDGKCWRCDTEVTKKPLEQWFFRITAYAEQLLQDLNKIKWSEKLKAMQKNWIGKSEGTEVLFKINKENWSVFTTRPDTLFGVTFLVISPQHSRLFEITTKENKKEMEEFIKKCNKVKTPEETEKLDKEGAFTGSYAINPLSEEKVPIYVGNFVIAEYGSGMVMAVPAHDQRDFEFAKKYKIPIKQVIQPEDSKLDEKTMKEAYTGPGILINSQGFDDLSNDEAKVHITKALEFKKLGKATIQYKIRDWLISRQRYWGTPIPIIYCDKCGVIPVKEKELPLLLPEDIKFGGNENPMTTSKSFQNIKCPNCKQKARRETDTMGGFMDSSWYFLRYCDPQNKKEPFSKKQAQYWMPVDQYIGGIEHAVGHLMYARFFTKVLRDLGYLKFDEPFTKLLNQGVVYKDGVKMSKSKGNIVTQDEIAKRYGIDTARLFLMFVASPEKQMEWTEEGIEGSFRLINKIIALKEKVNKAKITEADESKFHSTLKKVTESIENFEYPKAIISIMELTSYLSEKQALSKDHYETLLKLISPFCPHITEELWSNIKNKSFISLSDWPKADESKINPAFEQAEKSLDKTLEDIKNILNIVKQKSKKEPKAIYLYTIPKELSNYNSEQLSKKLNIEVKIFANNDKTKHDPQNKASKASPGRPAIYIE